MVYVPYDIVCEIIDAAYYTPSFDPDHLTLARCSLISRTWAAYAQKLLFRHVKLSNSSQFRSFKAAVQGTTRRGRRLGDSVLILRIELDGSCPSSSSSTKTKKPDSGVITASMFASVLRLAPRLYELDVAFTSEFLFDNHVAMRLRKSLIQAGSCSLPSIQGLRISQTPGSGTVTPSALPFHLLTIFPTIKFLVLDLASSGIILPLDRPPLPPFELTEFRWISSSVPSSRLIRWILSNSAESLQILHLSRNPNGRALSRLLLTCGPNLRSLRMRWGPSLETNIKHCNRLEELIVLGHASLSSSIVPSLPLTLEHLSYGHVIKPKRGQRSEVGKALRTLVSLRLVTCSPKADVDRSKWSKWSDQVTRFCVSSGIDLRYCAEAGSNEELIPVTTFPRETSLSNFRLRVTGDDRVLDDFDVLAKRTGNSVWFKLKRRCRGLIAHIRRA